MNIREWDSLCDIKSSLDKQRGGYDDIFEFFVTFYHMMVFEKSFVFSQSNSLGNLEIDILDEYCKRIFKGYLSAYSSACSDEVIRWCIDNELMLLLSANELSEREKSRVYMFSVLLKKTVRVKMYGEAFECFNSIGSLVNELCSSLTKQSCYKKFSEIEERLNYWKVTERFKGVSEWLKSVE